MEQVLRELSLRRRLAVGKREGGGGSCLAKEQQYKKGRGWEERRNSARVKLCRCVNSNLVLPTYYRYSSSLYRILLESWGRLDFLWGEPFNLDLRMTAVSLLKKALTLEPKVRSGHLVYHMVQHMHGMLTYVAHMWSCLEGSS